MNFIERMFKWLLSIPAVAVYLVAVLIASVLGLKNSAGWFVDEIRGQWFLLMKEPTAVLHWLSGWGETLTSWFSDWRAARAEKKAEKAAKKKADAEAAMVKAEADRKAKEAEPHWLQDLAAWLLVEHRKALFVGVEVNDGDTVEIVRRKSVPEAVSSDIADGDEGGECDEEFLIETEPVDPLGDTDEVLAVVTLDDEEPYKLPTETEQMRSMLSQVAQVSEFRLAGISLTWQEQLKLWSHICRDRDKSDRSKVAVQEALTKEVESWTGDEGSAQQSIQANLSLGLPFLPEFP